MTADPYDQLVGLGASDAQYDAALAAAAVCLAELDAGGTPKPTSVSNSCRCAGAASPRAPRFRGPDEERAAARERSLACGATQGRHRSGRGARARRT